MFPVFLGIVPLFLLLRNLGMWNNYFGLIASYVAYSLSFTIFVLTGFFKQLPGGSALPPLTASMSMEIEPRNSGR